MNFYFAHLQCSHTISEGTPVFRNRNYINPRCRVQHVYWLCKTQNSPSWVTPTEQYLVMNSCWWPTAISWSLSYGSWMYNYLMQSMPSTTKVVSPNPVHGEVYSIKHYVIKFVSDLLQVRCFLWALPFPSLIKLTSTV